MHRPLHIVHLTAGSGPGGISRYLFDLSTALHARGHRVTIAGERGAWHDLFARAPWPWLDLPLQGGPVALYQSARALERHLRAQPADLIHAHYRRATLVSRRLKRRLGLPVLFTLHATWISLRGLQGWFSDFGDHVHVPTEAGRRWLVDAAGVPDERITVIPHGIDPAAFPVSDEADRLAARGALGLPADATIAAYVGRFEYPKNEDWMLDVAAARADLRVVMIGGGPHEAALRRRVADLRLGDRVTLLPYGDARVVYRACDAVLLPSQAEGFSLATTEAMASGRPVLRTRTAGTEEHVVEGVTGRSVAVDREAFVAAALEFLADRQALDRMGAAGARHVRAHLTFAQQLERTLALYRRLVA